jgi:putative SOS response-associated peptidase YedK
MCGRYGGIPLPAFKTFGIDGPPSGYVQSPNIAPGSRNPVFLRESPLHAELMKWGLLPFWSKEAKVKFSTFNARCETVAMSAAYREPFKKRRCLVPAVGFYEWQKHEDGTKQPYFIHLKSRDVFAFAGLWDSWKDVEGKEFRTYTIVTCEPNDTMAPIHTRMPVILAKEDEEVWTTVDADLSEVTKLMKPYRDDDMITERITKLPKDREDADPGLLNLL